MSKLIIVALLLASFNWRSWSGIVKVKSGEDAVLSCRNLNHKSGMHWASLVNNGNYTCIATNNATLCPKMINNPRFQVTLNNSVVVLDIKHVKMADSGFYFCVFDIFGNGEVDVVQLNVEDKSMQDRNKSTGCDDNFTLWMSIALGSLCILILVIVGFALQVEKYQTAQNQGPNGPSEEEATDDLNYAAVNFQPKARQTKRALHIDPNVIYSGTR